jgi:Arm DNA-binding domain
MRSKAGYFGIGRDRSGTAVVSNRCRTERMPSNGRAWLSPSDPGAPTGFRLMVTASGYRAYYLIYRPRNGDKSRAYRIGTTEDLSYKEAKTKAEAVRGIVAGGKDPVAEKQTARERKRSSRVVTVRDVFDYFLEVHRTKLDHKTILGYEETRDVLPRSFLDEPAENVTPAMFRKLISDKTKAPVMQNRHLSRLKAAVRFARSESYIGRLPAIVEMKKPHTERKRKARAHVRRDPGHVGVARNDRADAAARRPRVPRLRSDRPARWHSARRDVRCRMGRVRPRRREPAIPGRPRGPADVVHPRGTPEGSEGQEGRSLDPAAVPGHLRPP